MPGVMNRAFCFKPRQSHFTTLTVFVPYYVFAIYAFVYGLSWIQVPSIVYSSMMMAFTSIAFVENYVAGSGRIQLGIDLTPSEIADIHCFLKTLEGKDFKISLPILPKSTQNTPLPDIN